MKTTLRVLTFLALALPTWASCNPARLTQVTGTLYLPNGSGYNGQLTIGWGSIPWEAEDGTLVPSGPPIALQIKNGAVNVCLQPTDGSTNPTPIQYQVIYRPAGSGAITQYWNVPTSGTAVTLASVIVPASSGPAVFSYSFSRLTSGTNTQAAMVVGAGASLRATSATATAPLKAGTVASLPATCTIGDMYFATNATAGQNTYFCTATNTWTQQLNSGTSAFSALTSGTNSTAAMVIASGATLRWSGSTEPTCDSSARGLVVLVTGGAGVADTWRICSKDSADVYAFRPMF